MSGSELQAALRTSTRILGVDPGTAITGYGVLDYLGADKFEYVASGIVQTHHTTAMPDRLKMIRADILSLLVDYEPAILVIESLFFFKNAKTIIPVAQARGVILEAAATRGVPVAEYNPMQVKLHISGFGRADKKLVQLMVAKLLNHEQIIKPDDAADAVALAVCHARASLADCVSANVTQP